MSKRIQHAGHPFDMVFINPPHHGPDYYSPIGLNLLASLARKAGYMVDILDFQRMVIGDGFPWPKGFFVHAQAALERFPARAYGFSVMNVGFPWAVQLAKMLKRMRPDVPIVFGGPHATILGHEILNRFQVIDFVATSEGETMIVPFLNALRLDDPTALASVPNLLFRKNGEVRSTIRAPLLADLDVLPVLTLDDDLLSAVAILSVEAGRGCPYRCSFCSSHAIWTRKPRFKSARRLVDEAQSYVDACPQRAEPLVISYEHDDFLANRPLFREFAAYKKGRGANFRYTITTRINHLTDEIVELLAESGCISVFMGLETGSERLQSSSHKHLKLATIPRIVRRLRARRMHVATNFIVGFPDETYEDVLLSVELMTWLSRQGCSVNISMMCPEPGSEIHAQTAEDRYVLLCNSLYARELREGGLPPERLDRTAAYHLVTIANVDYDIQLLAVLVESLQFLMTHFPVLLLDVYRAADFDIKKMLKSFAEFARSDSAIRWETIVAFRHFAGLEGTGARSDEFFDYECARYAVKTGQPLTVRPDRFSKDMPHAYFAAIDAAAAADAGRFEKWPTV